MIRIAPPWSLSREKGGNVGAINAPELWDIAVSDDGLLVLRGDEARLAEIARLQQEQRAIGQRLKTLKSVPVHISRGET